MAQPNSGTTEVYHEKQRNQLCGLHALNNVFQDKDAFTEDSLNYIDEQLAQEGFISDPHIGDYEISVLQMAVKAKGYQLIQFDKRRRSRCLVLDNIRGFIVHTGDWSSKGGHWSAIALCNTNYFQLDSLQPQPEFIGPQAALFTYLSAKLRSKYSLLFCLVKNDVAENDTWMRQLDIEEERIEAEKERIAVQMEEMEEEEEDVRPEEGWRRLRRRDAIQIRELGSTEKLEGIQKKSKGKTKKKVTIIEEIRSEEEEESEDDDDNDGGRYSLDNDNDENNDNSESDVDCSNNPAPGCNSCSRSKTSYESNLGGNRCRFSRGRSRSRSRSDYRDIRNIYRARL